MIKLSVIIPTRNRSEYLSLMLTSLTKQDYPQHLYEAIVIDNNSSDDTKAICYDFMNKMDNLRYGFAEKPGLHEGRHLGLKMSTSDILVYADDDIEPLPTWLSSIANAFVDPSVALVGGNNIPLFETPPPEWLIELWKPSSKSNIKCIPELSIIHFKSSPSKFNPYHVWGCNFSIRKDVLVDAGGFNPDGFPTDLQHYRGDGETSVSKYIETNQLKCTFHPGASVYHHVSKQRMTVDYFHNRGFRQGISDSYSNHRNKLSRFQVCKKKFLRYIKSSIIKNLRTHKSTRNVVQKYQAGYKAGYRYHSKLYREDPRLQSWVHKENYLTENFYD